MCGAPLEAAALTPQPIWEGSARYLLGIALVGQGRLDEAMVEYDRGASGLHAMHQWAPTAFAASLASCRGQWADAVAAADRAHELGTAIGDTNEAVWCGQRARIEWHRGRFEEAMNWAERGEQTALGVGVSLRPVLLGELGRSDAAAEAARRWSATSCRSCRRSSATTACGCEPGTSPWTRTRGPPGALLADLEGVSARLLGSETTLLGTPTHAAGLAAGVLGSWDETVRALEHARAEYAALAFPVWDARAALDLGRALLARDEPGTRTPRWCSSTRRRAGRTRSRCPRSPGEPGSCADRLGNRPRRIPPPALQPG